jgi:ADP-heptose:LPS heptosyltransferase
MWTTRGFADLSGYLINEMGFSVLFFGSKEDNSYIKEIINLSSNNENINVQTSFNLGEFITAIPYCDYFICLDSLAQHIAQYYNIPAIIIYMAKNSARWSKQKLNIKPVILENKNNYDVIFDVIKGWRQ